MGVIKLMHYVGVNKLMHYVGVIKWVYYQDEQRWYIVVEGLHSQREGEKAS